MLFLWLFFLFSIVVGSPLNNNDIVPRINGANLTFTARHYHQFDNLSQQQLMALFGNKGSKITPKKSRNKIESSDCDQDILVDLPENFDARQKWPQCEDLIGDAPVQGNCSASWALIATASITDRRCIAGISSVPLSAWDLLSCCEDCQNEEGNGCSGGDIDRAFQHAIFNGIVTGSIYMSHQGCKPWPLRYDASAPKSTKCVERCELGYPKNYTDDLTRIVQQRSFQKASAWVMKEIQANGPVVTKFDLYEDLLYYVGGIYEHKFGNFLGKGYAKIIGWGVNEKKIPYWLAVNTFGYGWGESGLFKIKRGNNEVNFEANILAGVVKR